MAEQSPSRDLPRGLLKIFIGVDSGIATISAMLEAARQLQREGRDVVVGLVGSNHRQAAQLHEGFETIPHLVREHPAEFDLSRALTRRPEVLVIEDLAHRNAPGCRHERRFQDVLALLEAGIDVLATLDVRRLESLATVVHLGGTAADTVPDSVLDRADDLELVELPPDELLARLANGTLALPAHTSRTAQRLFQHRQPLPRPLAPIDWSGAAAAAATTTLITAIGFVLRDTFSLQDQVMLYLVGIMAVSARFSRSASVIAAALAVAAYDFFFVPPLFTFSVSDATHVLTFAMMFAVGMVISSLTLRLRRQERASRDRESRTSALYALSRDVAKTLSPDELASALARHAQEVFGCDAGVVLHPGYAAMTLHSSSSRLSLGTSERAVVRWVLDHGRSAGQGTETLPGAEVSCFPIAISGRVLGALVLKPAGTLDHSAREFVDVFVQPAVLGLERVTLTAEAQRALVHAKSEQLRATLLSTVSHDLRTPLAAITGAAGTLRDAELKLPERERHELLLTIEQESARLERLIANLLEMTRLETGAVQPRREWVPLSELVASTTQRLESVLGTRVVTTAGEGTLLHVDPVLFEQVLVNLFENAARHTPEGTRIDVSSRLEGTTAVLEVRDRGPGIDQALLPTIFERFVRGKASPGTGLGLAIVKSIVTIHGGTVRAHNHPEGGACFTLTLPQEKPPV